MLQRLQFHLTSDLFHFAMVTMAYECSLNLSSKWASLSQKMRAFTPSSYLPGRTAATNAVRDIRNNLRTKFVAEKKDGLLQFGGAVTVDGVHLKLQRKHYYDFTPRFLEVKENGPFSGVSFFLRNVTLLPIESPAIASACNIRKALNDALLQNYNTLLDSFLKRFTTVTDEAAVMARVANASVSRKIHAPDENWMRCMAHVLNTSVKAVMSQCKKSCNSFSCRRSFSCDEGNN